jgi:hypothetical protein
MELKMQNKIILIDSDYLYLLNKYKWYINSKYIVAQYKNKRLLIHRIIMNAPKNKMIDHINGNTLDNRKCNLRICNRSQNFRNRTKQKNNTSGYKGVSFHKRLNKWQAQITTNKNKKCLGYFDTPELAFFAYCKANKKYHGEFGRVN